MPHANYIQTELIDLQAVGDQRGSLIALEQGSNLPFNMKRVYYIFDTKAGVSRGFHAHKSLQQLVVCVAGSCRVVLDNGKTRENFWLNTPTKGLFINKMIWRELHDFSEDCVLIVFASEHYNEADYIRDYNCFIENVNDDSVSLQK
ncbi:sugar 3,4-ketoisomerase [Legionella fairfieldensis]|uniref:sugar 3,4-ketoisomerase n=1 Tax=Legionella fairfieldensis TaxID=45064 RepID=UPI001F5F6B0C|nr:FdtA/QdtA family cupin domain-containing protein [Legionella fairfieldensis]